ncbi:MAG TPA: hypothetical protein DCZ94_15350 [Lentisphaeria bacterium]|nr:MAG: macrolide ABC transporter ATP-binding protein [Lentisphaerae bacterium GWF2_49_21]HBC88327.1 hypothetical protein [Lentisphaeria bacterium]
MSEGFIQARGIYKDYKIEKTKISVLRGANLDVRKGEWIALLGASGSGKTTLLNIIGALESPDQGDITFDGFKYSSMSREKSSDFRLNKVGFIFQAYHMLPELTILENVKLPAMLKGRHGEAVSVEARELLDKVGLGHRLKHKPAELSGGEQQRAAIARALINSPLLVLADEPTGNLDSKTGSEILEIFKKLHSSDSGKTMIMVTHDPDVATLADRIVHMKDGIIVESAQ